ncbi:hypothetical protein J5X84_02555 [Streptosporangiaceae bacterium NEAU-GS5]|nr:hypothetical protein [Streptosporangiaceae bacterium NEAU-GS5]
MSDPQIDPAGNTQAFRAFAQNRDAEVTKPQSSRMPLWIALGVVLLIAIAIVAYLLIK